jgi:hypothetical protein
MQPVEKQIEILAHKVDDVYQILDRLHHHLLVDTSDQGQQSAAAIEENLYLIATEHRDDQYLPAANLAKSSDWLLHQDVLVDHQGVEAVPQQSNVYLSPQSQIQRLTAQLTVAYSRIAVLEEQLLSQRLN